MILLVLNMPWYYIIHPYILIGRNKESEISTLISSLIGKLTFQSIPSSNIDPPSSLQMVMNHLWKWVEVEWSSKWLDMFHDNVIMDMLFLFCRDWWILDDRQSLRFQRLQGEWFKRLFDFRHVPPAFFSQLPQSPNHSILQPHATWVVSDGFNDSDTAIWQTWELYITWKNANPKSEHASSRHWCLAANLDCNGTSRTRCFPQVGCPLPVALLFYATSKWFCTTVHNYHLVI